MEQTTVSPAKSVKCYDTLATRRFEGRSPPADKFSKWSIVHSGRECDTEKCMAFTVSAVQAPAPVTVSSKVQP